MAPPVEDKFSKGFGAAIQQKSHFCTAIKRRNKKYFKIQNTQ